MTLHRDQPTPEPSATTLDCLIVGGGIHGVHVAARLIGEAGVPADRLRILDPGARLLERWRSRKPLQLRSHTHVKLQRATPLLMAQTEPAP